MSTPRWPAPPVPGGFGFPLGFATGIAVTLVTIGAGATGHPGWSEFALVPAVAGVSMVTTLPAAIATAAVCWCLHDGFVLGRHGDLVFTSASASSAAALTLTALVAATVAVVVRTSRNRLAAVVPHIPAQRRVPSG